MPVDFAHLMSKYLFILIIGCFIMSCAQIATLSGGDKDIAPPVLDSANTFPKIQSTNFNSQGIVLAFDEYFKLDKSQISINPGVTIAPSYKVKGKNLFINLDAPLDSNTTYSINFGNSIKDATEGNIMKNFKYVFSTGAFIDSLTYSGKINTASQSIPVEGAIIGMYRELADSLPFYQQPNYIGVTDEKGRFHISNIKEGFYKVVAMSDENENYLYDELTESIGFLPEPISIDPDSILPASDFYLFKSIPENIRIVEKIGYKDGIARFVFNKPIEAGRLEFLEPNDIEDAIWNVKRDSMTAYTRFPKPKFLIVLKQIDGGNDTIRLALNQDLPKFKITNVPQTFDHLTEVTIRFNNILSEFYSEEIHLMEDSLIMAKTISINPALPNTLVMSAHFKLNSEYTLSFDSSSVMDIAGRHIDSSGFKIHSFKENYFGSIGLNIVTENMDNMFIQLLDSKGKMIRISDSFYGAGAIDFDNLKPGKYLARLVFDKNFNNAWDTGNYKTGLAPERVLNYESVIEIRSNWNMNEDWKVD
jgi:uncharacterized protein (DUF2141 family)